MQEVHGNQEASFVFPVDDVAVDHTPNLHHVDRSAGIFKDLGQDKVIGNVGLQSNGGPTTLNTLGKRPRDTRSPPSVGSTQGPPIRHQHPEESNVSINLNQVAEGFSVEGSWAGDAADDGNVEAQSILGDSGVNRRSPGLNPESV
ncbi:hypothetical protein Hanom_Chr04g00298811 [Helianthus anomalus]